MFPGDPEFTFERYSELPSRYVLDAVKYGTQKRQEQLHEDERPVALLSSIFVNSNRNPKKSKPAKYQDFCFYVPLALQNLPNPEYGSAAMRLMAQDQFPAWALFIYKDLKSVATTLTPPRLALRSDNALILAPSIKDGFVKGMLVAQESALGEWVEMIDDDDERYLVQIPPLSGKVTAQEDLEMVIRPQLAGHSPSN